MENIEFKSGSKLARSTIVLLVVATVFQVIFATFQAVNITFFDGIATSTNPNGNAVMNLAVALFALILMLLSYASKIVFLVWQFRVSKNLHALNSNATTISPGWNVGWWFIPFASLVMPLKCISEIVNGSDPENNSDETYVSNQSATNLTGFWWFFYLFGGIFATANAFLAFTLPSHPENQTFYVISMILFEVMYLVSLVLLINIIRNIDANQEISSKTLRNSSSFFHPPPPPTFNTEAND